ncbi:hypothetical protein [Cohnella sp. AR92]|uniref:hypothetical protein n=1 Tax=Cohnella sp. AR92 TaxID=648716 RepID=UPI00131571BA|nr:hypothetical protein [Cohnella sp. AR92]
MTQLHVVLSFVSICSGCGRRTEQTIKDFGRRDLNELEQLMGEQDVTVTPIVCPKCGFSNLPTIMKLFDKLQGRVISEAKIGADVPVIDDAGQAGYVNTRTEEEQAEIDRGVAKWVEYIADHSDSFWQQFEAHAHEHWTGIIVELTKQDFEEAYGTLSLTTLGPQATVSKYRRDVEAKIVSEASRRSFWRAANQRMYQHLVEIGIEAWDVKNAIKLYGRERVRFLILQLPIPEELEGIRSQAIGELVKKESGDQAFLYRRIKQLSSRLDKSLVSSNRYHQQSMDLQDKLAAAYRTIEQLEAERVEAFRPDTSQTSKIERLKGLITELKTENKRLNSLLPVEEIPTPPIEENVVTIPQVDPSEEASLVEGKTIGVLGGWPRQADARYESCTLMLHDARRLDPAFYAILRAADAIIVWTEFISHEAMWEIKEWAADRDIPVNYLRGMNLERALREIRLS